MKRMSAAFDGPLDDLLNYVLRYFEIAEPISIQPVLWREETYDGFKLGLLQDRELTEEEIKEERLDSAIPPHIEISSARSDPKRAGSIEGVRVTDNRAELICRPKTDDAEQCCSGLIKKMKRDKLAVNTIKPPGRSKLTRQVNVERAAYALWAEELKSTDPEMIWPAIGKQIGWSYGTTDESRRKSLENSRNKIDRLKEHDPEGILEEAKARYQELKRKRKIMR